MEGLNPGSSPKATESPWASDFASKGWEDSSSCLRGWPRGSKLKMYVQILAHGLIHSKTKKMLTSQYPQHPILKPGFPEMKRSLNEHLW